MEKGSSPPNVCQSVFRAGGKTTTIERFTAAWIQLINKQEKNKSILAGAR